ncbi:MAG: Fis family transcriptional regulator [Paracoccus denitrificans]|nr:MAG: Fis family transcriptional regulator [Paracoccus denitrificans]PZO85536.1 MAG: Fis family transcriptional regulator [Paracoccus denitrificans]
MTTRQILLIEDDDELREAMSLAFELADFDVRALSGADEALLHVGFGFRGVVVSDIRMPGIDGITLMKRIHDLDHDIPVILVTGHGDVQLAVRAMRDGAYDFIEKPFENSHLVEIASRACEHRDLVLENRVLRAAAGHPDDLEQRLIGRSAPMIELREQIRAVGPTEADVLILGETGTGKEVVARALHDLSPRKDKPFVAINCAALPSIMIESELFGHEAGAFPGAMRARFGKFELARGGTILLDEIGAMPIEVQAKLLRVIQERATTRLGANDPYPLDVRFIATSKEHLDQEVAEGRFRSDLLYRLNVITLRMPSLAERREDIPLLFLKLVGEAGLRYRRDPVQVPAHVLSSIIDRDWPGNVRELRNAADRFGLNLGLGFDTSQAEAGPEPGLLSDRMAAFEKTTLINMLAVHGGNLKSVYEALGLSRKALYLKIRRHGLDRRGFAPDDEDE